jgi:glucose-1-phosphate cytidylyltransferase
MKISAFMEKPQGDGAWINGGYFVLEPDAINYIDNDATVWEQEPLQNLARDGMLAAYRHQGFWQCMDTQNDKVTLEKLWASGKPPWKVWE